MSTTDKSCVHIAAEATDLSVHVREVHAVVHGETDHDHASDTLCSTWVVEYRGGEGVCAW